MNDPILHIGYHKTGTSWLQKTLLPRHPELQLLVRRSPGAGWIDDSVGLHPFHFDVTTLRKAYESCLGDLEGRVPFVSYEGWIGNPYAGGRDLEPIARRLRALFPDGKIVVVIREPVDMLASLYRQYIQEGGAMPLEALVRSRYPARTYFDPGHLEYDRVLDLYAELFGRDRVCVLLFEDFREDPQRFLDQLLRFAGVAPLELGEATARVRNPSLSPASLRIARVTNRFLASAFNPAPLVPERLASYRELRRFLKKRVDPWLADGRSRPPREAISPALRAELEEHFRPHNRRLLSEHGIAIDRHDYAI